MMETGGVRGLAAVSNAILALGSDRVLTTATFNGDVRGVVRDVEVMTTNGEQVIALFGSGQVAALRASDLSMITTLVSGGARAMWSAPNGIVMRADNGELVIWDQGHIVARRHTSAPIEAAPIGRCGLLDASTRRLYPFIGEPVLFTGVLAPTCATAVERVAASWRLRAFPENVPLDAPTLGIECDQGMAPLFSPDGRHVAGGCPLRAMTVDSHMTMPVAVTGHNGPVRGVFSRDSAWLVTVGVDDHYVFVRDTTSWRPILQVIAGFEDAPYARVEGLLPSAGLVALGSFDNRARLYSTSTGTLMAHYRSYPEWYPAFCVSQRILHTNSRATRPASICTSGWFDVPFTILSPDGSRVITGGPDGIVRVFATRLEDALDIACAAAQKLEVDVGSACVTRQRARNETARVER